MAVKVTPDMIDAGIVSSGVTLPAAPPRYRHTQKPGGQLGQAPALRIHDLRHTFASVGLNAGATLAEIQTLLGHSSSAMTERYAHLSQDSARRASEVVSNAVADAVLQGSKRLPAGSFDATPCEVAVAA